MICEFDSHATLDLISEGTSNMHPFSSQVKHIRKSLNFNWHLNFLHTLREGNFCAYWLAKQGAAAFHGVSVLSSDSPSPLSGTLLADAIGVIRIRL